MSDPGPDRLRRTIAAVAQARPVVVVDLAADLGALVVAAETATTPVVAFMVRQTSGFLCAAAPPWVLDRLRIPPGRPDDRRAWRAGYGVSVDGTEGTGTGISAAARATTLRVLADPTSRPPDLVRPGHVMTMRVDGAGARGVAVLPAAACDLVRLATGGSVACYAHLVGRADPTGLAGVGESEILADEHGLEVVRVADVRREWAHPSRIAS